MKKKYVRAECKWCGKKVRVVDGLVFKKHSCTRGGPACAGSWASAAGILIEEIMES